MSGKKKSKELKKKLLKKRLKKQKKVERKTAKKQEKAVRKAAKKLAKRLSASREKPFKAVKAAKAACASNAAPFRLDLGTCPCCSKRCPLSKPRCGKGRAVARKKRERLMDDVAA